MAKPPPTPPHSDLDGVASRTPMRNTDAAVEAGQDAGDLDLARRKARRRPGPRHSDERQRRPNHALGPTAKTWWPPLRRNRARIRGGSAPTDRRRDDRGRGRHEERLAIYLGCALALAGCSSEEDRLENAIRETLARAGQRPGDRDDQASDENNMTGFAVVQRTERDREGRRLDCTADARPGQGRRFLQLALPCRRSTRRC